MNNLLAGGTDFLFMALGIAFTAGMIPLLIFLTKKEKKRYTIYKFSKNEMTKQIFDGLVARKCNRVNFRKFSIYKIGINNDKRIIDSYGMDQYLYAIGKISEECKSIFKGAAKTCLYETDSLMLLVEEFMDDTHLKNFAVYMLREITKPISLAAGLFITFDVNVGIATYGEFCTTQEELYSNLNTAWVTSSRMGSNQYALFDFNIKSEGSTEIQYYNEVKQAIKNEEFTVFYQPIYNVDENKVFAYEALIRWEHKELGVLPPNKFINILESSGDINWVGMWELEEMIGSYQKLGNRQMVFTMNLSPKQLTDEKLFDNVRTLLRKYPAIAPNNICFEISEINLYEKSANAKNNIERLSQAGFLITIDNYGTDMNALSVIQQTKIDAIKLDRSFVMELNKNTLNASVVAMLNTYSKQQNIMVIANGIEDDEMLESIKVHDIHYAQGYLYSKPKNFREFLPTDYVPPATK